MAWIDSLLGKNSVVGPSFEQSVDQKVVAGLIARALDLVAGLAQRRQTLPEPEQGGAGVLGQTLGEFVVVRGWVYSDLRSSGWACRDPRRRYRSCPR